MLESVRDYWYMWLILVFLIILTVFVMRKAAAAVKKRHRILKEQEQELRRYKFLLDKYTSISKTDAMQCDDNEIAEGITAVLQRQIEKSPHPEDEFNSAEKWRRTVYALYYFAEDTATSLSFFFKNNGEPLVSLAVDGVKIIGETSVNSEVSSMFTMYDENNERVSIDKEKIEELNDKFLKKFDRKKFFYNLKCYITEHIG